MPDVSVGRSLSAVGGQATPVGPTINSRMSNAADRLTHLNDIAESVLARIHGTPDGSGAKAGNASATPPMTSSLANIEGELERMGRLIESLQQVA